MELKNQKQFDTIKELLDKIQANTLDFDTFIKKTNEQLQTLEKEKNDKQNIILTILENNYEIVLATGFIRELRKCYPQANIIVVLDEEIKNVDNILVNNPNINELVYAVLNTNNYLTLIYSCIQIAQQNFWNRSIDKAFSISWPGSAATLFFNWLSGAKDTIGYGESIITLYNDDIKNDFMFDQLLTSKIIHPAEIKNDLLRKYYILNSLNFDLSDGSLELFIDRRKENRKIICVDISNRSSNWVFSLRKLAQFLLSIVDDDTYIMLRSTNLVNTRYFILLLTTNVYSLYDTVHTKTIDKNKIIDYDINLMQNIQFYIGNNTEAMHIASAYNKPIIAFFAESEDKELNGILSLYDRLRPYGWIEKDPPARILRPEYATDVCVIHENIGGCCVPYPHCINEITIEQIENAYNELFKDQV